MTPETKKKIEAIRDRICVEECYPEQTNGPAALRLLAELCEALLSERKPEEAQVEAMLMGRL